MSPERILVALVLLAAFGMAGFSAWEVHSVRADLAIEHEARVRAEARAVQQGANAAACAETAKGERAADAIRRDGRADPEALNNSLRGVR